MCVCYHLISQTKRFCYLDKLPMDKMKPYCKNVSALLRPQKNFVSKFTCRRQEKHHKIAILGGNAHSKIYNAYKMILFYNGSIICLLALHKATNVLINLISYV